MPRLLLVDDNPSIHKIAESLLAHSDIELVCTDGGAKALALLDGGASFDAFLLDISMAGMDGWQLLEALRARPDTRRSPVALMAGVLDVVDPGRLAGVSAQDFLKKPIELKDLAQRVHHLMTLPVEVPEPMPEPEPVVEAVSAEPAASSFETVPGLRVEDHLSQALPEDLLLLTEEDLWAEPVVEPSLDAVPVGDGAGEPELQGPSDLQLEDLDLAMADLASEPEPEPEAVVAETDLEIDLPDLEAEASEVEGFTLPGEDSAEAPLEWGDDSEDLLAALDVAAEAGEALAVPSEAVEPEVVEPAPAPEATLVDTLELDASAQAVVAAPADDAHAIPETPLEIAESSALVPDLPLAVGAVTAVAAGMAAATVVGSPEAAAAVPVVEAADAGAPAPQVGGTEGLHGKALVEAILADREAMDLLVQTLSQRMSDQALREVAWEVMPDLAERMRPY